MKPKVIWTSREWSLIAHWFLTNQINPDHFGFTGHLKKAQEEVLPVDRQRAVKGIPAKLKRGVRDAITLVKHQNAPAPTKPIEAPEAEALSTEELLVELARRVAKLLEPSAQKDTTMVDRGFHPKHDPSPKSEARPVQKRILIVGPMAHQQEQLRRKFYDLRLVFVTCEDSPSTCAAGSIDECILWTKFMNHAHQDVVKSLGYNTWYANSMAEIEARLRTHV